MNTSEAKARASMVFPVPGGPANSTPAGSLAPNRAYFFGLRIISTTWRTWSFAASMPCTSSNDSPTFLALRPNASNENAFFAVHVATNCATTMVASMLNNGMRNPATVSSTLHQYGVGGGGGGGGGGVDDHIVIDEASRHSRDK
jgi:hypothetical protein